MNMKKSDDDIDRKLKHFFRVIDQSRLSNMIIMINQDTHSAPSPHYSNQNKLVMKLFNYYSRKRLAISYYKL